MLLFGTPADKLGGDMLFSDVQRVYVNYQVNCATCCENSIHIFRVDMREEREKKNRRTNETDEK